MLTSMCFVVAGDLNRRPGGLGPDPLHSCNKFESTTIHHTDECGQLPRHRRQGLASGACRIRRLVFVSLELQFARTLTRTLSTRSVIYSCPCLTASLARLSSTSYTEFLLIKINYHLRTFLLQLTPFSFRCVS